MTMTAELSPPQSTIDTSASGSVKGGRVNRQLAFAVLALLAIVPLPLGSNRPAFWALSAFATGLLALWMYWAAGRKPRRVTLTRPGWVTVLAFLAVLGYLLAQVIPLGAIQRMVPNGGALITPTFSLAPGTTLLAMLQWVTYGVVAWLAMLAAVRRRGATILLWGSFGIVTGYAALGLLLLTQMGDSGLFVPKTDYPGSATGPFVNRNSYATFLSFGLVTGMAIVTEGLARKRGRRRPGLAILAAVIGMIVIGAALLATNSRMGSFAGGLGVVLVLTIGALRGGWPWLRVLLGLAAAAFVLAAGLWVYGGGILERVFTLDVSFQDRLELYRQVVEMVRASPLLGFGGGAFEWAFPLFHQPPLGPDYVWDKAHSSYLTYAAELGLLGGSLLLLTVACLVWRAGAALLTATDNWGLALAALGVTAVAVAHSLFDFSLEIQANTFLFIAILAAGGGGWHPTAKRNGVP